MSDDRILSVLRQQAWQRAKGELQAIMATYYNDHRFEQMAFLVKNFIVTIDNEGLAE